MLEEGVIEPSDSPWASPVVMVPKGPSGYRLCIDYRKLNACAPPMRWPIGRTDDVLDAIGIDQTGTATPASPNGTIFTTLDMISGYWQVPLDDASKPRTAVIVTWGLHQWKRLPFGYASSGQIYAWCRVYYEICSTNAAWSTLMTSSCGVPP